MESFGFYDDKGHWHPPYPCERVPLFAWPPKPLETLKWLFGWGGFLFPQNVLYVAFGWITAAYLQPGLEQAKNLAPGWILWMLLRNFLLMGAVYGGLHLVFYTLKLHGKERKYHPSFHQEKNRRFLFGSQVYDNVFRSLVFGLPIWTAYEVLYWWAAANGRVPVLAWKDHPVAFVALFVLIPFWRSVHFYLIHRLIHWRPLFMPIHSVHHKNPNPGPWTGMAMHPLEHLLYLSVMAVHFVVPSSPWHFFFHSQHVALGPAFGHLGFEGPLFKGTVVAGDYFHYLHHKHVSCNFGINIVPMDQWFGRFFDGVGEYRSKG